MTDLEKAREAYEQWGNIALEQDPQACTDYIRTLETELSKARETALEEAAKVAEGFAPFSQASIASASSSALLDNEASVTRSIVAHRAAAAIRSLSHKEG